MRLARALAEGPDPEATEFELQFEEAALLARGPTYGAKGRFTGSGYRPVLETCNAFLDGRLRPGSTRRAEPRAMSVYGPMDLSAALVSAYAGSVVRWDPHSYADDEQPETRHIDLEVNVNFAEHTLEAIATLRFDRAPSGVVDLDSRDLAVRSIVDDRGEAVRFELGTHDRVLGRRLRLFTDRPRVSIEYRTSPEASALQWLGAEQTASKKQPFVFTQCQAIHARSVLPCQDTPGIRFTYDVDVTSPDGTRAVFAAAPSEEHPGRFSMPQPIPAYLFAFAAGDLERRELSSRSRVWGEGPVLDVAAHDFAEVESMVEAAEALFGPYAWDRFDLLVMPPSFPYGGMENPRLTFLTPTLLTGDRSLVHVVAHELAHAWTGNLVTNASAEHFWLNEGFTVYAERRIVEALEGVESAALHAAIGRRELDRDLERLGAVDPQLTALRTHLDGRDPDQVFSTVPYEKGFLFLRAIEAAVGRKAFDVFLAAYIERFRFRSITTEAFVGFLDEQLPEVRSRVELEDWLHEPGLPESAPAIRSASLDALRGLANRLRRGEILGTELDRLSPTEWQVLLAELPRELPLAVLESVEAEHALSHSANWEIRTAWLSRLARQTSAFDDAVKDALSTCGRMKFLRPLYRALLARGPEGRARAEDIYAAAHERYHPVAKAMVADLLGDGAA